MRPQFPHGRLRAHACRARTSDLGERQRPGGMGGVAKLRRSTNFRTPLTCRFSPAVRWAERSSARAFGLTTTYWANTYYYYLLFLSTTCSRARGTAEPRIALDYRVGELEFPRASGS
eukprot:1606264-Prymnesium_polylepis.1